MLDVCYSIFDARVALQGGLEVLRNGSSGTTGGIFIVITDGIENKRPNIEDVQAEVNGMVYWCFLLKSFDVANTRCIKCHNLFQYTVFSTCPNDDQQIN